ncbi:MAG: hypothetical protein GX994_05970 [Firmicutes bacterium]|nr:hypothetical protein [Bacillota bacterium]
MNQLNYFIIGIALLAVLDLIRAILGRYAADRLVATNAITTKVCVIILGLTFIRGNFMYLDIALVFVLCSFIGSVNVLRLLLPPNQKELLSDIVEVPTHLQKAKIQKLDSLDTSNTRSDQ